MAQHQKTSVSVSVAAIMLCNKLLQILVIITHVTRVSTSLWICRSAGSWPIQAGIGQAALPQALDIVHLGLRGGLAHSYSTSVGFRA